MRVRPRNRLVSRRLRLARPKVPRRRPRPHRQMPPQMRSRRAIQHQPHHQLQHRRQQEMQQQRAVTVTNQKVALALGLQPPSEQLKVSHFRHRVD